MEQSLLKNIHQNSQLYSYELVNIDFTFGAGGTKICESWKSPPPNRVTATMTRDRTLKIDTSCVAVNIFQVINGTYQLCHFARDGGVALGGGGHIVTDHWRAMGRQN